MWQGWLPPGTSVFTLWLIVLCMRSKAWLLAHTEVTKNITYFSIGPKRRYPTVMGALLVREDAIQCSAPILNTSTSLTPRLRSLQFKPNVPNTSCLSLNAHISITVALKSSCAGSPACPRSCDPNRSHASSPSQRARANHQCCAAMCPQSSGGSPAGTHK